MIKSEHERLLYISKSKKQLFDSCPLAFKFSYIDKIKQGPNVYFEIGTDVHDYIDNFFEIVNFKDNGELEGISNLKFTPNLDYKKNVAKFELNRAELIFKAGFDKSFFNPPYKEKKWTVENPKLVGVVDRVHKCFKGDPFAPKDPDFKDGDLVIVENKTGKPSYAKAISYKTDLIWYKIIMDIAMPEIAPIKWGAVYFPFDNYIYHCKLEIKDCREVSKSIKETREKIQDCLETDKWEAKPSEYSCKWCSYKDHCRNTGGKNF